MVSLKDGFTVWLQSQTSHFSLISPPATPAKEVQTSTKIKLGSPMGANFGMKTNIEYAQSRYSDIANYWLQNHYFQIDYRAVFFTYESKSKFLKFLSCPKFFTWFFAMSAFAIFYIVSFVIDVNKVRSSRRDVFCKKVFLKFCKFIGKQPFRSFF